MEIASSKKIISESRILSRKKSLPLDLTWVHHHTTHVRYDRCGSDYWILPLEMTIGHIVGNVSMLDFIASALGALKLYENGFLAIHSSSQLQISIILTNLA